MNTTPPLTDAELLAYIERTPELTALLHRFRATLCFRPQDDIARAFHAHEQRVRGEMQAKIDRLVIEYCPEEMTPGQTEEWSRHQVPEFVTRAEADELARRVAAAIDCGSAEPFKREFIDPIIVRVRAEMEKERAH